ncbi:MAG: hypothetical protein J0H98_08450 [Solirubrobacterales bacterium]|nr:hypothetical protein [Solirubrobacterales bacterium]
MPISSHNNVSRRAFRAGGSFIALLGLLICLCLTGQLEPSDAAGTKHRIVLGANKNKVTPNCGIAASGRTCFAEGNITAYQVFQKGAGGKSFVVPYRRGKVISWSISLSQPIRKTSKRYGQAQMPYFNRLFGKPSKARISVIRQVQKRKKGPPRYKLVRQSPLEELNRYFGTTVRFALSRPLNVIHNDIVALTIPTWAPAFWVPHACDAADTGDTIDPARCARAQKNNTWRGSRGPKQCVIGTDSADNPNEALQKSHPQQKVGSVKRYGCYYSGSRLLYTATVVAK